MYFIFSIWYLTQFLKLFLIVFIISFYENLYLIKHLVLEYLLLGHIFIINVIKFLKCRMKNDFYIRF